jgi:RNA polymerase sigma factor (sigma-70 family)
MNDDAALLRRYAENRDEPAFAELVRRHLNLVYSAALRRLGGDTHRAADVSQHVFTALARDAQKLSNHAVLTAWLYTATRHAAIDVIRTEQRRRAREQEASAMQNLLSPPGSDVDWVKLRPVLDEVMDELSDADRTAVLLRFFEQRSFAEIGAALAVGEDAARMRVERALDKLHGLLAPRGVTSTAAALATVLANQAVVAAPAGLVATITSVAQAGAGATGGAVAAAKIFTYMSTTKIMAGVAGIIAVAATAITWQQRQANAELRSEMGTLRQQTAAQVASLRAENERVVAEKRAQEDAANAEHIELTQLRAARDAFRKRQAQSASVQPATSSGGNAAAPADGLKPGMVSVDALQNVGRNTPRAAAQTMMSAAQHGDTELAASCLAFDPAERAKLEAFIASLPEDQRAKFGTPELMMASVISGSPKPIAGVQLLKETNPDADTAVQEVQIQYQSGEVRQDEIKFRRDPDGWKQVVSPTTVDHVIAYFKGRQ